MVVCSKIPGAEQEYLRYDSFAEEEKHYGELDLTYPLEYLNSLEFSGLHAHKICLKVGVPIMLLRNINQAEGLCNGTRLIVTHLGERVIKAEVLTASPTKQIVLIPRIVLSPTMSNHPFILRRRQFPVKVSYAMTINKSQGQTLAKVALYLPKPVFTHGQLYATLSRVTTPKELNVLNITRPSGLMNTISNIVYREAFNALPQTTVTTQRYIDHHTSLICKTNYIQKTVSNVGYKFNIVLSITRLNFHSLFQV